MHLPIFIENEKIFHFSSGMKTIFIGNENYFHRKESKIHREQKKNHRKEKNSSRVKNIFMGNKIDLNLNSGN